MKVSLEELKTHLRVEHEEEDAYLSMLLRVAEAAAEDFCKTTFKWSLPQPVRLAVLLHASHFYLYREESNEEAHKAMRQAFRALLWPYRNVTKLF